MNKMNWKWTLVCAAALVGATVLLDAVAWAGKPVPPPPPTPPIRYQINYFTAPDPQAGERIISIMAMNNFGVMVGEYLRPGTITYHGFIYNRRVDLERAIDLNDIVEIPEDPEVPDGWYIDNAYSINDWGAILVTVEMILHPSPSDPEYERRGLLIDTWGKPFPSTSTPRWTATGFLC